jgi:hypothetical protein
MQCISQIYFYYLTHVQLQGQMFTHKQPLKLARRQPSPPTETPYQYHYYYHRKLLFVSKFINFNYSIMAITAEGDGLEVTL